ncbi:protein of unknown function DUF369 [Thermofilum pendens Hrk 5]|uniref:Cyclophilin TM1367-like domain-containing protein n=2 Tax=Thermofilum pendens TaxID=2269 RepID=A1S1A0_THEPD|nr:protein of unknown function DUF369 [Thermofilum pendens Hrk 5]
MGMYLRIIFGGSREIPVYVSDPSYHDALRKALPIESTAELWKEEVYFSTNLDLRGPTSSRVPSGTFAYWPPGKALCLFAWVSQPYGAVIPLGWLLGPKHYVLLLDKESSVRVEESRLEEYPERVQAAVRILREAGFLAAPRTWNGVLSITGASVKRDTRVGFEVFVEEHGYIIESDPVFKRDFSPLDEALQLRIKAHLVKSRVDVNEEGYVILSDYAPTVQDLVERISRVVSEYQKVIDVMSLVG